MRHATLLVFTLVVPACAADLGPEAAEPGAIIVQDAAAHVAEAERLWRASCPVPGEGDLCVERVAVSSAGRCGPAPTQRLVVRARDGAGQAAAHGHLVRAAELARAEHTPASAEAATRASFLLGEEATEAFLAREFPLDLDFAPAHEAASKARFDAWIQGSTADLKVAKDRYLEAVTAGGDDAIAASVRVAQLYERYAREVAFARVPADVVPFADATAGYCGALADEAVKLVAKAAEARGYCQELVAAAHGRSHPDCGGTLEPSADLAAIAARATRPE